MADESSERSRVSDKYDARSEDGSERAGGSYKGRFDLSSSRGFRRGTTGFFRPSRGRFSRARGGIDRGDGSRSSGGVDSGYHSNHRKSARSHSSESRRRSRTRSRSRSRTSSVSRLSSHRGGRYYPSRTADRYSRKRRSRSRSRNRRSRSRERRSRSRERRSRSRDRRSRSRARSEEHKSYRSRSRSLSKTRFSSPIRLSNVRLYSPGRYNNDGGRDFHSGVESSLTDLSFVSYAETVSNELSSVVDHRRQDRITSETEEFLRVTAENEQFTSNRHLWKPVGDETSSPLASYSNESPHFNADNFEYTSQPSESICVEEISSLELSDINSEEEDVILEEYDSSFVTEDMGPGRNWDRRSDRDYHGRGGRGYGRGGRGGRNDQGERTSSIVPKHTSSIVPKNPVREEVWKIPKVLSARDMDAYDDDVHCDRYAIKVREQPMPVVDLKPKVESMFEVKSERKDMFGDDDYEPKYNPSSAPSASSSVFSSSSSFFKHESSRASSSSALPGLGFEEPVSQTRSAQSRSFLTSSRSLSPRRSPKSSSESEFTIPGLGNIGNMNADEEDEFLYGDGDDNDSRSKGGIPGLGDFKTPMTSSERRSSTSSHSRQSAVSSSDPRNLGKILNNLGLDAGNSTLAAKDTTIRNQKRTEHVAREITDLYHRLHDGGDKSDVRTALDPRASNHRAADPRSSGHGISDPRSSGHGTSDPRSSNHGAAADPRSSFSDRRLQSRQSSIEGNEKNLPTSYSLPVHQELAAAPPSPAYHNPPPAMGQYPQYPPDPHLSNSQPSYDNYQYDPYYQSGYPVPPPPLPNIPPPCPPPPPPPIQHQHLPVPVSNYQIPPPPQPMYPSFSSHPPPSVSIPISTTETKWQPQPIDSQINRNNLKVVPIQATTTTVKTPIATPSAVKPLEQAKSSDKNDGPKVPTTLEERMHLKGEYAQQQKKLELLRVELERCRRQQGELMRKKQKQKDGHNDPQLLKNGKLQDDYKRQIYNVEITLGGIEKSLKASEGLIRSGSSHMDYTSSPRNNSRSTNSSDSSRAQSANKQYRFVDPGDNWCVHCGNTYPLATDLLKHLHSEHADLTDNIAPADRPWAVKPKEPKPTSVREISVKPFQGVEFMLPCLAYFCKLCREFSGDHIAARTHLESEKHNANYQKHCQVKPDYPKKLQTDRAASVVRKREEKKRKVEQELKDAVAAKKRKATATVVKRESDMEISDGDNDVVEIQTCTGLPIRLNLLDENDGLDNQPESSEEDGKSSSKIAIKIKELATSLPATSQKSAVSAPAIADQRRTQQRILSNLYKNKKKNKEKGDVRVQQPPLEEFVSLATMDKFNAEAVALTEESKTTADESPVKITPQLPEEPATVAMSSFMADESELLPPGVDEISVNVPMPSSKSRQTQKGLASSRKSVEEDESQSINAPEIGAKLPDSDLDDEQGLDNVINSIVLPDVLNITMEDNEEKNTNDSSSVNLAKKNSVTKKEEKEMNVGGESESVPESATVGVEMDVDVDLKSGKVDKERDNLDVDPDASSLEKQNGNVCPVDEAVKDNGNEVIGETIKKSDGGSSIRKQQTENSSIVGSVDIECDRIKITSREVVQNEQLMKSLTPPSMTAKEVSVCIKENITGPITVKTEINTEELEREQKALTENEEEEEEVDVKPDVRLLDEAIARSKKPQRARCSRGRAASVSVVPMLAKVKVEPGLEEKAVESKVASSKNSYRGRAKRGRGRRGGRGARNVGTRSQKRKEQTEEEEDGLQTDQDVPGLDTSIDEATGSSFKEDIEEKNEVLNSESKSEPLADVSPTKSRTEEECAPSSPAASDLSFGDMEVVDEAEDTE